ncbi:nuclear transport factor 2 family protein [Pseudoalteromonas sp.]|uniref:nuclear transport factor 2 family protein n=1 Tax=Pseudoalteromonas sp. TaxID=53249 RepID=UPI0035697AF1
MKPLSIAFALFFIGAAAQVYATEQHNSEPETQTATEQVKAQPAAKATSSAQAKDKLNTLEYQQPVLQPPVIDKNQVDDSKVLGTEAPQPAAKLIDKQQKAQAIAEAEQAVTQAKDALTLKQQNKAKQSRESLAVIEQLVNAYNARNIEQFLRMYDEQVEFYIFPNELLFKGKEKLIARYGLMFKKLKCIHSSPIKRIVLGDIVIDHELSETCSQDANVIDKRSELISSYQIKDGKIIKVLFFR